MSSPKATVLVVEDDRDLGQLVCRVLTREEFTPTLAVRGDDALEEAKRLKPNLVILDLMLPGVDGFQVCRELREWFRGPILMLTARDADFDQILGLELGADDYVIKPVEPRVLIARIRALLRRRSPDSQDVDVHHGSLRVSLTEGRAFVFSQEIDLTTAEVELLSYLARHAGEVLSRELLYQELRGISYDGIDRSIDLRISRVRRALRALDSTLRPIRTVHGRGYLFRKAP
ncbi:MAG: response regulator [Polyangiales bacterium]